MRAWRRRPRTDHHRSSDGQGPAHPVTSAHGPPATDSRAGAAVAIPPPVTPTGSAGGVGEQGGQGPAEDHGGRRWGDLPRPWPSRGRPTADATASGATVVVPITPEPALAGPVGPPPSLSGPVQGTNRARWAGPRPPWSRPLTTASGPSSSWTPATARAARASASAESPQNPTWRATTVPTRRGGARPARECGGGRRGESPAAPPRPPGPPAGRGHLPRRNGRAPGGRAAPRTAPSVRTPSRTSRSASSGRSSVATGHGTRKEAVSPGGTITGSPCRRGPGGQDGGEQAVGHTHPGCPPCRPTPATPTRPRRPCGPGPRRPRSSGRGPGWARRTPRDARGRRVWRRPPGPPTTAPNARASRPCSCSSRMPGHQTASSRCTFFLHLSVLPVP